MVYVSVLRHWPSVLMPKFKCFPPFCLAQRCCTNALAQRPVLACSLVCTLVPRTTLVCYSVHVNETVWPEPMLFHGPAWQRPTQRWSASAFAVGLEFWLFYPLISTLFTILEAPTNLPSLPLPLHFLFRLLLLFLALSKPSQAYWVEGLGVGSPKKHFRGPGWGNGLTLAPLFVNFLSIPLESMCDVIFLVFWACRSVFRGR